MSNDTDWRLTNQMQYLFGVVLQYRKYSQYSKEWDHDHCEFCWEKLSEQEIAEGYTTKNSEHWICKSCFDDLEDRFSWIVID